MPIQTIQTLKILGATDEEALSALKDSINIRINDIIIRLLETKDPHEKISLTNMLNEKRKYLNDIYYEAEDYIVINQDDEDKSINGLRSHIDRAILISRNREAIPIFIIICVCSQVESHFRVNKLIAKYSRNGNVLSLTYRDLNRAYDKISVFIDYLRCHSDRYYGLQYAIECQNRILKAINDYNT